MVPFLPRPQDRPFWLLSVDVVPHPRPYAETLTDGSLRHICAAYTRRAPHDYSLA